MARAMSAASKSVHVISAQNLVSGMANPSSALKAYLKGLRKT
jgi:hypothetical protein